MKVKKIWAIYFFIKVFYMFFAIYIFSRITTLGDTFDYLNSALQFTPRIFYSSTALMQFIGAISRSALRLDILACIPFMLLSFYGVYYAVDRLNLYRYSTYILILFSLPNFGVWTSVLGKDAVGCFFMCIISVVLVKKLHGKYTLQFIDYLALYLCLIFKPQYLLFVLQAIVYLTLTHPFKDKKNFPFWLGIFIIAANVIVIYLARDLIDELARGMAIHFKSSDPTLARSTRSELPWVEHYGFFKSALYGMFISFFGPTFSEMIHKPAHMLSGLESLAIIVCFLILLTPRLKYILKSLSFNPRVFMTYLIVFIGILFLHYPFGFLNPGSAIRYRSNFYALFVILLLYLLAKMREKNTPKLPRPATS
ncbi:MAG: hypothetical protein WKF66_13020 [Pedobacter sp.]